MSTLLQMLQVSWHKAGVDGSPLLAVGIGGIADPLLCRPINFTLCGLLTGVIRAWQNSVKERKLMNRICPASKLFKACSR